MTRNKKASVCVCVCEREREREKPVWDHWFPVQAKELRSLYSVLNKSKKLNKVINQQSFSELSEK